MDGPPSPDARPDLRPDGQPSDQSRDRSGGADRSDHAHPSDQPQETELERWQRNFAELLQELRVAQMGVQILFAFLLSLAFNSQFQDADTFQQTTYLVALLTSAAATALLIAPVAQHRMLFRRGRKPDLVRTSHRMALGGLALLLVAMASSVLLASDVVLDRWAAIVVAAVSSVWFVFLWAAIPWLRRQPSGPSDPSEPADPSGGDPAQRVRHR